MLIINLQSVHIWNLLLYGKALVTYYNVDAIELSYISNRVQLNYLVSCDTRSSAPLYF